jgi:biotin-dependent carboxylase-like uncharacterized protein
MLKIEKVGLMANVIDAGRAGVQAQGFSQSGALDWLSFEYANAALGQPLTQAAIEVLGGHFSCRFMHACVICISGADAELTINGKVVSLDKPLVVAQNAQLVINRLTHGIVNYIALKASLHIPTFGQSVCAVAREKHGGIHQNGTSLQAGDYIAGTPTPSAADTFDKKRTPIIDKSASLFLSSVHAILKQKYQAIKRVNFTLSYQANLFTHTQIAQFINTPYELTQNMDRMGIRLKGKTMVCKEQTLPSQGMVYGAIQVPGDGQPIVMRNDRQTIGGYPVIGVVDRVGMAMLGQAVPGQHVVFSIGDFEDSRQKRLLAELILEKYSTKQAQLFTN